MVVLLVKKAATGGTLIVCSQKYYKKIQKIVKRYNLENKQDQYLAIRYFNFYTRDSPGVPLSWLSTF